MLLLLRSFKYAVVHQASTIVCHRQIVFLTPSIKEPL
jgi:hypothetical protein